MKTFILLVMVMGQPVHTEYFANAARCQFMKERIEANYRNQGKSLTFPDAITCYDMHLLK